MAGSNWGDGGRGDFPQMNEHNYNAMDLLTRIQDPTLRVRAMERNAVLLNDPSLGFKTDSFANVFAFCGVVDYFAMREYPEGRLNTAGIDIGYFTLFSGNRSYIVGFAIGTMLDINTGEIVPSRVNANLMLSVYSADGNIHLSSIDPGLYADALDRMHKVLEVFAFDPRLFILDHSGEEISSFPIPNTFSASIAHFDY